jgi:two-component system, chemotaxis family, protein-glutamate methylesterase/glutaminase
MPMSSSDRLTALMDVRRRRSRILVADDSDLMRSLLQDQIRGYGDFLVVGEAATGYQTIRLVHELNPDIVTLDLQMPELGGLGALDYIMSEAPRPVVIVSAHSRAMAEAGLDAMMHGALDFVAKPADASEDERILFRTRLREALSSAAEARRLSRMDRQAQVKAAAREAARRIADRRTGGWEGRPTAPRPARCAVAVAASTGGPRALEQVVASLPGSLPAAVFIVQHMPALFTAALARRLDGVGELPAREASHDEVVLEGTVYVAPGGRHLDLDRAPGGVRVRLTDEPAVWSVRPAADVMFAAVARMFGPASVGAVLTGMGQDGTAGLQAIREVGGATLVQDETTSVIASMPRSAAQYADAVLPLPEIAAGLADRAELRARLRPG